MGKCESWKVRPSKVAKLEIGKVESRKRGSVCGFSSSPRKFVSYRKTTLYSCKNWKMKEQGGSIYIYIYIYRHMGVSNSQGP